jgi:pyruvate dehydrogenase E2 component (dihydrolipoamide acetyltransferase)
MNGGTEEEIKRLAEQYGINLKDVTATGNDKKVTLQDIEGYIKKNFSPKVKRENKLFGIRKIISERLSASYREAVHVTENIEVRMDNFVKLRDEISEKLSAKPSYTVLMLECIAKALKEFPELNASLKGEKIIIYDDVNINIAVETPLGLITPVIRNVGKKDLKELMLSYQDVIERSRKNMLREVDFTGGTFTVTNLGMYEIDSFTPIINPPQVAILGVNRIINKPIVEQNKIKTGKIMNLSLTFDHRVIDGALGAKFLGRVKYYLENPREAFEIT